MFLVWQYTIPSGYAHWLKNTDLLLYMALVNTLKTSSSESILPIFEKQVSDKSILRKQSSSSSDCSSEQSELLLRCFQKIDQTQTLVRVKLYIRVITCSSYHNFELSHVQVITYSNYHMFELLHIRTNTPSNYHMFELSHIQVITCSSYRESTVYRPNHLTFLVHSPNQPDSTRRRNTWAWNKNFDENR